MNVRNLVCTASQIVLGIAFLGATQSCDRSPQMAQDAMLSAIIEGDATKAALAIQSNPESANALMITAKSPLYYSILTKNFEIRDVLLNAGAMPNAPSEGVLQGTIDYPLNLAARVGDAQSARALTSSSLIGHFSRDEILEAIDVCDLNEKCDENLLRYLKELLEDLQTRREQTGLAGGQ